MARSLDNVVRMQGQVQAMNRRLGKQLAQTRRRAGEIEAERQRLIAEY